MAEIPNSAVCTGNGIVCNRCNVTTCSIGTDKRKVVARTQSELYSTWMNMSKQLGEDLNRVGELLENVYGHEVVKRLDLENVESVEEWNVLGAYRMERETSL